MDLDMPDDAPASTQVDAAAAIAAAKVPAESVQTVDEPVEPLPEDPAAASAVINGAPESDLEKRVKELEVQNQLLKAENAALREENAALKENKPDATGSTTGSTTGEVPKEETAEKEEK